MPNSIYIETTIPSYYVARPSRNILQLARQELTRKWWNEQRTRFDFYTSQIVLLEAAEGDAVMAQARLGLLAGIPVLHVSEEVVDMANELVRDAILPPGASQDAIHIAAAAAYRVRFLLTWNCKHIANPHIRRRIAVCFSRWGVELPLICTPYEFIGNYENDPGT